MEYIDLYLIHWPVSSRPGTFEFPIKQEDFLAMDFKGVWRAMEECQKIGLTKSIGVSNFSCKKLSEILSVAEIPPAVNQVSFPASFHFFPCQVILILWGLAMKDAGNLKGRDKPAMATKEAAGVLQGQWNSVDSVCFSRSKWDHLG